MKVVFYLKESGASPFEEWLDGLDIKTQARIQARLFRFSLDNLGDSKALGEGLFEARLFFGPGYRLYFAVKGKVLVVMLCGGDKSTQKRDIKTARDYLADYNARGKK